MADILFILVLGAGFGTLIGAAFLPLFPIRAERPSSIVWHEPDDKR